ncbi:hypothetical protein H0H92_013413 [Tricholoma furcatifolium]|nr:hypothetical protein H0H92_013413 [Tricholoma furcatifolium]
MATTRLHPHHSLPAPVVHAGFSVPQSKSHVLAGVQDAYWSDDEAEDAECPLCLEEMDISDLNFKPCICGYQICRFCWHHIKVNLNKRCPACRRVYTDEAVEFKAIPTQDHKRLTQQKKQRERERKELETLGRRHLANVRVVQRNVVYVVGIGPRFAKEELIPTLRSNDYFGQYGKITKIILVKRTPSGGGDPVVGLYITYYRREDAARAIAAVDGAPSTGGARGDVMRASYGTTKYCMTFLRGVSCGDHSCMNLHEWGDEKDCFTKEDLTTLKHTMKTTESRTRTTVVTYKKGDEPDGEASDAHILLHAHIYSTAGLPRAASWAQKPPNLTTTPSTTTTNHATGPAARQHRRGGVVRQSQPRNVPISETRTTSTTTRTTQESKTTTKPGSQASSRPTTPPSVPPPRVTSPDVKDVKTRVKKESVAEPVAEPVAAPPAPSHSPVSSVRTDEPESKPPSVASPSPAPRPGSTDSSQAPPSLPPGLPMVPPGLPAPPGIPIPNRQFDIAPSQTPILSSQSSYQMSTAARALLDDVKARRESALPAMAGVSPFPDFDRTLQTLAGGDDGGFSFNLDPKLAGVDSDNLPPLPEFEMDDTTPFRGSYLDAFPALRTPVAQASLVAPPGLPYPHANRPMYEAHTTRSSSAAGHDSQSSSSGYMGSFNPFADAGEDVSTASAAPIRQPQYSPLDDESSRKVSRFGFARGKQSSTATSSPLHGASPLNNGNGENHSFYPPSDPLLQGFGRPQWSNGRDYGFAQTASASFAHHPSGPHSRNHLPPFESGVSEAQLRDLIQSSRERAQSHHGITADSHPPGLKPNSSHFQDPAIMSARLASSAQEPAFNQMPYGPPPGLSFPHSNTNLGLGVLTNGMNGMDGNGSPHVSTTASPSLSLALSSIDFPALTASPVETSPHEESIPPEDSAVQLDDKAREKAERKAAKKAAAAEKAAERQRLAQEKAAIRAAERAKLALEKQLEKEKALAEKEKALAIKAQEKASKEQAERERMAKAKEESERLAKERAIQAGKERQKEKDAQMKKKQMEDKRLDQQSKPSRQNVAPKPAVTAVPPEAQLPLLSKKPKKNKPAVKSTKVPKEESPIADDSATIPSVSTSEAPLAPTTDSSANNSRSHSLDRNTPTPVEDLLEQIDISNPAMDLPNHPFFDSHRLSPAATVPLEYGPLVHALSALSVGGGSFANNMPSGSIDNAVSSFQQLLETLTQTISDLLRLLPRTTWDDSSSFDGVLRDMLKGDDFLDDGGDDGHGKEDEVAALTLALERRARWMEVQLSKLEELHRDINTAAVRAVLSFNDNGWDRRAFLPRAGHTLRRFDHIGFVENSDGTVRTMTTKELEKELVVVKEMAVLRECEVREVMETIQAFRPMEI